MTEKQKMLAGDLYRASDTELRSERTEMLQICGEFNRSGDFEILRERLGSVGNGTEIMPLFRCDYGYNIHLGDGVNINYDCVILDVCEVRIGNSVLIAPKAGIYTATHPVDPELRKSGQESGKPITICNNVWIGGGVTICPGVTIGENSVIGAGAVVVADIPANVVAVGNPCRAIKRV